MNSSRFIENTHKRQGSQVRDLGALLEAGEEQKKKKEPDLVQKPQKRVPTFTISRSVFQKQKVG